MPTYTILGVLLAVAMLCVGSFILIPAPATGIWRFYIPAVPSCDGAPKWADLEFNDGNVLILGTDRPTADIGSIVGSYSNTGFGKYFYSDATLTGTFRPGWFRATIELDEAPGSNISLKRISRKENKRTQQSGAECTKCRVP